MDSRRFLAHKLFYIKQIFDPQKKNKQKLGLTKKYLSRKLDLMKLPNSKWP